MPHLLFSQRGKQLKGFNALKNRLALFNPRADRIREAVRTIEGLINKDDKELEKKITETDQMILQIKTMQDPQKVNDLVAKIIENLESLKTSLATDYSAGDSKLTASTSAKIAPAIFDSTYKSRLRSAVISNESNMVNTNIEALTDEILRRAARYSERLSSAPSKRPKL